MIKATNDRNDRNSLHLVFLVHRIPYPPDKGDKIRSFNLLVFLAKRYRIHLIFFVDDKNDWKYVDSLREYCETIFAVPLSPWKSYLKSIGGFITGDALSIAFYRSRSVRKWTDETIKRNPVCSIVAFSSVMGQFVLDERFASVRRIMDFVDIDSDKWKQYTKGMSGIKKWIYQREAKLLLEFEREIAASFDASVFVSESERRIFSELASDASHKIYHADNGVNSDYFDPNLIHESPYSSSALPLVFTGTMNYWPNADAVRWFVSEVFPLLRKEHPLLEFWIVGGSPSKQIKELTNHDGVYVTGRVDDVRPYLNYSVAAVAPLRIARGVQNKVLEALSMAKRVVCTSDAAFGLTGMPNAPIEIADTAGEFVSAIGRLVRQQESTQQFEAGRRYILENYCWNRNLSVFSELISAGSYANRRLQ